MTDTQTTDVDKAENAQLLAEMVAMAARAPEPGEMRAGTTVLDGSDATAPVPVVTNVITSAGYRWIYDRRTGERSRTNFNMLQKQLTKLGDDGLPMFVATTPQVVPKGGTHKCFLHPDDPNRAHYDEMGLPTCRKATLRNAYEVQQHMQRCHKNQWKAIEQERQEKREAERFELEKAILRQAAGAGAA